jgi:hypothetical protein
MAREFQKKGRAPEASFLSFCGLLSGSLDFPSVLLLNPSPLDHLPPDEMMRDLKPLPGYGMSFGRCSLPFGRHCPGYVLDGNRCSHGSSIFPVDYWHARGVLNISPCAYWKDHQREWPVLTRLARDLLSIPATGAGTGRLLAVAQNFCRTRGGSVVESTMRDLVMYAYSEGSESGKSGRNMTWRVTMNEWSSK